MKYSREFLVGGFTLLALLLLASVTIYLQQWDFFNRRASYNVFFKSVNRLERGAPVNVSGIQVGKVSRLEYRQDSDRAVRVEIQIDRAVPLYSNARVQVNTAEVIGDTTVEIEAGQPEEGGRLLGPGEAIDGIESTDLAQIVGEVSADLRSTLQSANRILSDPGTQSSIKTIMTNLSSATGRLDETLGMINNEFRPLMDELTSASRHLNVLLAQGQGASERIGEELSATRQSLGATAGDVSRSAQSISQDFKNTTDRLNRTLDSFDASLQTFDATVQENRRALRASLDRLEAGSRDLADILERTRRGEGTLGRLITDPRPFDRLSQLIETLTQLLTGRQAPTFPLQEFAPSTPTQRLERP
jgi:phospholipid/cholesterol/gamma-HCH transport system substrate-binding protein